ncbi:MAG: metallophosphoesterase [Spirochaetales bacterium]|nr:metallophosphoesterase [Spirochaetales bacterium]
MALRTARKGAAAPAPAQAEPRALRQRPVYERMAALLRDAPVVQLTDLSRIVVFSDLHMGDGGRGDDFKDNAGFFSFLLRHHYLPRGYTLVLNGDIEELHKFSYRRILERWEDLYSLFGEFAARGRLYKTVGNHDDYPFRTMALAGALRARIPYTNSALRLQYGEDSILIFHGHQASLLLRHLNRFLALGLRYVLHPLGIRNMSISEDRQIRFRTERRVYSFSSRQKIISVIGHTHRPLFESLSKVDTLRYRIERLCRRYPTLPAAERILLQAKIRRYKQEIDAHAARSHRKATRGSLYNSRLLVPCVFNSGCAIGKRGITGVEISAGRIALVHWFDSRRSLRYFNYNGSVPRRLDGSDYYRVCLKKAPLSYVFSRIRLLT